MPSAVDVVSFLSRRADACVAGCALALCLRVAWRQLRALRRDQLLACELLGAADEQATSDARALATVAQRASRVIELQDGFAHELSRLRCAVERLERACPRGTREDFVMLPGEGNALVDRMIAHMTEEDPAPERAYAHAAHSVLAMLQLLRRHGTSCAVMVDDAAHFVGIADVTAVAWGVLQSVAASELDAQSLAPVVLQDTVMHAREGSAALLARLRGQHRYVGVITHGRNGEERCGVVSQYDVLRLLFEESRQRGLLTRSIQSLGLGAQKCVLVVHPTDTVQCAFRRMLSSGVTSLPLVDGSRQALGVISASDSAFLPASMDEWAETMNMPCRDFLGTRVRRPNGLGPADVVACRADDDLHTVVAAMLKHDVRHVYVTEQGVVGGVVSCVDVLRVLL